MCFLCDTNSMAWVSYLSSPPATKFNKLAGVSRKIAFVVVGIPRTVEFYLQSGDVQMYIVYREILCNPKVNNYKFRLNYSYISFFLLAFEDPFTFIASAGKSGQCFRDGEAVGALYVIDKWFIFTEFSFLRFVL